MATGKGLNDIGDIDACTINPKTEYAIVTLKLIPIYFGICVPSSCQADDLKILEDGVSSLAAKMGMKAEGLVYFPNRQSFNPSTVDILLYIFFSILAIFFIIGILVEYSSLFGKPNYDNIGKEDDSKRDKELIKSKNKLGLFFLSFSVGRNLRKMFYTPQRKDDNLTVFNGIRVLSMYFVVLGHTMSGFIVVPVINFTAAQQMADSWWAIYMSIGFYSVDVFFFLSAFLGAYLMISKFEGKRCFNVGMVYLHRIIRVIPSILLFTGLLIAFYQLSASGPIWDLGVSQFIVNPCIKNWWMNIVFINEFGIGGQPCIGPLWYLSNEIKFFTILPLIVLAYINNKKIGYFLTCLLIFICFISTFTLSHIRGHSITTLKDPAGEYIEEFYQYPLTRFGAYFTGVLFGIMYFEWMKSNITPAYKGTIGERFYNAVKFNPIVRYGLFFLGSCIMASLILIPRIELHDLSERNLSQIPSDIFNTFHRPLFVTGFLFFLSGAMVGRMKLIKGLFGGKLWAPWAKVTFTAYLFHILVLGWVFVTTKSALYATGSYLLFYSFVIFLVTIILSVPLTLIIESPILQLEKLILFPQKGKPIIQGEEVKNLIQCDETQKSSYLKDDTCEQSKKGS